jgi:tRNA(Ile)-lysidine synthase
VLLAALARAPRAAAARPLRAIHVDHGLHRDSARWSECSVALASSLGVSCEVARVDARAAPGQSPEAAARAARYGALAARLAPGEALLTAHHGDDQIETVLLQWLRGGGLRSVAGMRPASAFASGWHVRPMLGFTREQLRAWAEPQGLEWNEDPSNLDPRFDRNYLRLEVLPAIRARWPAAARTIARVAVQATEALALEEDAAAADLAVIAEGATLALGRLRELPALRQRIVLREWLRTRGLAVPSVATLEALRHDMIAAAPDRVPETRWPGVAVRRYRERLYADGVGTEEGWQPREWPLGEEFDLGALGRLELRAATGPGLSRDRLVGRLRVVPRPAGAAFRPAGCSHTRELRKWLQERGVLPWRRATLPVILAGEEIVAIGDLACSAGYAAAPGEPAWHVLWHGRPVLTEDEATSRPRDA